MEDTPKQTPADPIVTSVQAQLFVSDLQRSCNFYTEKLGFTVEFVYGDPPFYGQLRRDGASLNLRLVSEPVFVPGIRRREGLLSASLTLAHAGEIRQLFLDYRAAGVTFYQALTSEPWGASTFIVLDPDDNLLLFAGPAE